jgi:large subunit ribosomal protein L5
MATKLQEDYNAKIIAKLKEQFGYQNIHQVPKVSKIIINRGLGALRFVKECP